MSKAVVAGVLAVATLFGGCAGTTTVATVQSAVVKVQQAAIAACGYLPTATTVSGIIATLAPGVAPAENAVLSIAQQICAAVTVSKTSLFASRKAPTVNGIVVHGRFVR